MGTGMPWRTECGGDGTCLPPRARFDAPEQTNPESNWRAASQVIANALVRP